MQAISQQYEDKKKAALQKQKHELETAHKSQVKDLETKLANAKKEAMKEMVKSGGINRASADLRAHSKQEDKIKRYL